MINEWNMRKMMAIMMRLVVYLSIMLILTVGCAQNQRVLSEKKWLKSNVHPIGTNGYDKRRSEFKLQFSEAFRLYNEYLGLLDDEVYSRAIFKTHFLIVGDNYLFAPPSKIGIPVSGITVNGFTGELASFEPNYYTYVNEYLLVDLWGISYEELLDYQDTLYSTEGFR